MSVFRGHLATSVFLLVIAVGMGVGVTRRKKAVFVDLDGRDWFATKLAKRVSTAKTVTTSVHVKMVVLVTM